MSTPTVGRMLRSSARRPFLSVLAAVLALGVVTGCSEDEKAAPEPSPTPIASLNTVEMELPRIEFCQLVPDKAVEDAVGGKPTSDSSYGNGDEVECHWRRQRRGARDRLRVDRQERQHRAGVGLRAAGHDRLRPDR